MKIVAFSGWKKSGKDTAADFLIKEMGFKRFAFADALKEMVADQYNIPLEYCHQNEFKEMPLIKYPVETTDGFTGVIHNFLDKEFKELKVEDGDSLEFVKCWTPRALCILEGSIKRSVNSEYWVKRVISQIMSDSKNKSGSGNYVITDLRYKSEVKQLEDAFGNCLKVVRINRFTECDSTDPSERDLDDYQFDNIIYNRSTIEDFLKEIQEVTNV